jgi:hypothetical protein
LSII